MHSNPHLTGTCMNLGQIYYLQYFRASELDNSNGSHISSLQITVNWTVWYASELASGDVVARPRTSDSGCPHQTLLGLSIGDSSASTSKQFY
jgi:hypothetical protein